MLTVKENQDSRLYKLGNSNFNILLALLLKYPKPIAMQLPFI